MKFRKKPVVIDAIKYDGTWPEEFLEKPYQQTVTHIPNGELHIFTLEGVMKASIGDWIIRGIKGEIYPCKPDIFEATYEAINEE